MLARFLNDNPTGIEAIACGARGSLRSPADVLKEKRRDLAKWSKEWAESKK